MAQITSVTVCYLFEIDDYPCTVTPFVPDYLTVEINGEIGRIWVKIPKSSAVPIGVYCQRAYDCYTSQVREAEQIGETDDQA